MGSFEPAVTFLLHNEGGLVESPNDPGGITNMGISFRFLKSIDTKQLQMYGLYGEPSEQMIRDLNIQQATKLYYGEFWQHAPFDMIRNQDLCNYLFDAAVHMGIAPAIKCAQRACWSVFNNKDNLPDDGILGGQTLHCMNLNDDVFSALRSERAGDYRVIVSLHPEQKEFINGWLDRAYNR